MTKGRKATYEERIEIVSFCIANSHNYNLTYNTPHIMVLLINLFYYIGYLKSIIFTLLLS